ncbi:MAG: sigma-70 family RNA polymerase sigma factor [Cellulophaga sp.]
MGAYYKNFSVEETANDKENKLKLLLDTIKELPDQQQLVLRLFYLNEYSLKEISEVLAISVGTVKSRLFHAREKLKSIFKKQKR